MSVFFAKINMNIHDTLILVISETIFNEFLLYFCCIYL